MGQITSIHCLTVHRIIYCDLQVNCVKRRYAPQLFETNRVARLTRCKQLLWEVQFDFIWFRDEKCSPSKHHSTRRTIGFMHQLITGLTHWSQPSATHVGYDVHCRVTHKWVWLNWCLSTLGWRWKASITAMSCCLSICFQQSNVSQNVVYSQNNMLLTAKFVIFCVLWFPKVR